MCTSISVNVLLFTFFVLLLRHIDHLLIVINVYVYFCERAFVHFFCLLLRHIDRLLNCDKRASLSCAQHEFHTAWNKTAEMKRCFSAEWEEASLFVCLLLPAETVFCSFVCFYRPKPYSLHARAWNVRKPSCSDTSTQRVLFWNSNWPALL